MGSEIDRDRHGVLSPEGVMLELPIAGPAPRIFAYGVDFVLVLLLMALVTIGVFAALPAAGFVEQQLRDVARRFGEAGTAEEKKHQFTTGAGILIALLVVLQLAIELGYFVFWELVTGGRSPGKALLGLRVVRLGGLPIDLRASVVRNVLRVADILPANYVVGLVSMLVSRQNMRLGDAAAGTVVVRLDRPETAPDLAIPDDLPPLLLTREQVASLGERELRLVRSTLRRAPGLDPERGERLIEAAAASLRGRLALPSESVPSPRRFLYQLLAADERRRKRV